ncbi:MAG: GTPase HflX [Oscillospiraceae bacterium]|jgi:GTP-binding protein HflX|nr:GTPase HflX [Oscillospiraceae bacterium]
MPLPQNTADPAAAPRTAVLIAADTGAHDVSRSLAELTELAANLEMEAVAQMVQTRSSPDHGTYFGRGKLEELKAFCEAEECRIILCDDELTPAQQRGLETFLNGDRARHGDQAETEKEEEEKYQVLDRTMLILDIFADRARSSEGKLQVELATLQYSLPRITGQWMGLSRQGGGIGTRGRGETKYETDRRHIRARIHRLERDLAELARHRGLRRERRKKTGVETAAIVGYTNAGKSTLLNALTGAGVLAEDKLFATLDPTARALTLPDGRRIMLTDTVGLIRRLPHHLVEAFHSTLEEALEADLILHVCDVSAPDCAEQMQVTADLLRDLGCEKTGIPVLPVLNKCDLVPPEVLRMPVIGGGVQISALTGYGLEALLRRMEQLLPPDRRRATLLLPYAKAALAARFREEGSVESEEFRDDGVLITAILPLRLLGEAKPYLV